MSILAEPACAGTPAADDETAAAPSSSSTAAAPPPPAPDYTPGGLANLEALMALVLEFVPELRGERAADVEQAICRHFGGARIYIRATTSGRGRLSRDERDPAKREAFERRVRQMFNGRNASEIARRLGIGRATVYRCLKKPGGST